MEALLTFSYAHLGHVLVLFGFCVMYYVLRFLLSPEMQQRFGELELNASPVIVSEIVESDAALRLCALREQQAIRVRRVLDASTPLEDKPYLLDEIRRCDDELMRLHDNLIRANEAGLLTVDETRSLLSIPVCEAQDKPERAFRF